MSKEDKVQDEEVENQEEQQTEDNQEETIELSKEEDKKVITDHSEFDKVHFIQLAFLKLKKSLKELD